MARRRFKKPKKLWGWTVECPACLDVYAAYMAVSVKPRRCRICGSDLILLNEVYSYQGT